VCTSFLWCLPFFRDKKVVGVFVAFSCAFLSIHHLGTAPWASGQEFGVSSGYMTLLVVLAYGESLGRAEGQELTCVGIVPG
jgi:hypothetical protein